VELNDLVQAGYVGLVNASRSYKSDVHVPFGMFARYRVRGEILDSLRRLDGASRKLRYWHKQMDVKSRELCATLHREPTDEELSESLSMEIAELRKKKLALRLATICSTSTSSSEEPERFRQEQACAPESRPDAIRARQQMKQVLAVTIHSLPVRSREVIILYYSNELTMKQIGKVMRVDESRVSQIHKGALQSMARTLRSSGILSSTDL
jgi:RNA polymerase sigma factor for flagellar operon FliA